MDFCSLQHMRRRRSTHRGLCLPASFRPQGFLTLSTACSLRGRAGFVSHRLRSWDSPFGAFSSRQVFGVLRARTCPRTVSPATVPLAEASGRPGGPRFLGFYPAKSPMAARRVFSTPIAGGSLGFSLSRLPGEGLGRDFARPPLARFSPDPCEPTDCAPESQSTFARPQPRPCGEPRGRMRRPS